MRDVAAALSHLATVGIIHRDVSPANILRFGDVWKLCDFGISRTTLRGTTSGTEGWSDPHQKVFLQSDGSIKEWFGWRYRPDRQEQHKVDVYSLGQLMAFLEVEAFFPPGAKQRCQEPRLESRCSAADVLKWAEDALHQAALRRTRDQLLRRIEDWSAAASEMLARDVGRGVVLDSKAFTLADQLLQTLDLQVAEMRGVTKQGSLAELFSTKGAELADEWIVTSGPVAPRSNDHSSPPLALTKLTIAPDASASLDSVLDILAPHCSQLRELRVVRSSVREHPTDARLLKLLQASSHLRVVDLTGCANFTDTSLRGLIKANPEVKHLNVKRCKLLTDYGVRAARFLHGLEYLNVSGCPQVTETSLLRVVQTCAHFRRLDVTWCDALNTACLIEASRRCKQLDLAAYVEWSSRIMNSPIAKELATRCTELQLRNVGSLPPSVVVHIPDLDPVHYKVVLEHGRCYPVRRWTSTMLPTDPYVFTTADMRTQALEPREPERGVADPFLLADERWEEDSWRVETWGSEDGWLYAVNFPNYHVTSDFFTACTRRRMHVRRYSVVAARVRTALHTKEKEEAMRSLLPGQCLRSPDGRIKLIHTRDGNVGLYDASGKLLWSATTSGAATSRFALLPNGVIVLRNANQSIVWSSSSTQQQQHQKDLSLRVTNEGFLTLSSTQGVIVQSWPPST